MHGTPQRFPEQFDSEDWGKGLDCIGYQKIGITVNKNIILIYVYLFLFPPTILYCTVLNCKQMKNTVLPLLYCTKLCCAVGYYNHTLPSQMDTGTVLARKKGMTVNVVNSTILHFSVLFVVVIFNRPGVAGAVLLTPL